MRLVILVSSIYTINIMGEQVCIRCREPVQGRRTYTWTSTEQEFSDIKSIILSSTDSKSIILSSYQFMMGSYNILFSDIEITQIK